ncbi:glycoside hydrolase superfamily [Podospora aff. communis PSN243]|uniref:Glycoside hydrolase superfamily n=1 Tax=Podospora aff. communis PSN243 TaxID=3040156 RepID=A0AAV9GMU8_9PEZI|nr:glycoside hydrolase superfamily [Podospora aff. communis PSN243]
MTRHVVAVCCLLLGIFAQSSHQLQLRNVTDFNLNWLFHYGDANGADASAFADGSWRPLSVPHDWAIEGPNPPANPFLSSAATMGYGAYAPSGISWYRKHFSLAGTPDTKKIYIEFDGVMQDASFYVNGKLIATHPYGYTSIQYDITSAVTFTGSNVIAVKTDTSKQPGERFYKGAGIYRDVRLVVTDPVHIDQYGLYVSTPNVTSTAATVRVQLTVLNSGSSEAVNISVHGVLSNPSGIPRAPVTAATTQEVLAAGARATFTFDVPVSNPAIWDLSDNPPLYSLAATVSVGGIAVDDESTTLGIRAIAFSASAGMTLNGKSVKFKGVCLHQDYHALGMAAPKRAMQRRLGQLKTIGVNAIRTAHDPPSPAFLDLTDRMGFLVLDEFFDVWTEHKYSDVGDYAKDFNQVATPPTGTPPVPGTASDAAVRWYEVDVTSIVSRDRNHPSVALYSTGNEIRDSLGVRTPLLARMKQIINALDPGRAVTQALMRPDSNGDITGATRTIVDVFGANYRPDEVLKGMALSPARAGLLTEQTTNAALWDPVKANPALTGLFVWTGMDYLGEANGQWPNISADFGLFDAVGELKSAGYAWQKVWGGAHATTPPAAGTSASKIALSSDQEVVSTDVNDIAYVQAIIADSSGRVVTGSTAAIVFNITGPGVVVAVDSGSMESETFRGTTRMAYRGIAYALVRATGEGTITVTAATPGLTAGSVTLTGTTAPLIF